MNIRILQLLEGAKNAEGLTVVIDVFRAFSLECYLFYQGAERLLAVADLKTAYQLKKENPGFILMGERNERIAPGFDYGNSPTQILNIDFTGKTIVHSTSAGTQGLVNAIRAEELLTGSFVNAKAITRYIQKQKPETVSLVCMGYAAMRPTEEDTICAEYIKSILLEETFDIAKMRNIIRFTSGKRLFEPANQDHSPETDFYLCTDADKFDFVLTAQRLSGGYVELKKNIC